MEKHKLLGWAVLAKLSDNEQESNEPGLRINRHTVIETLREIQVLLLDFANLDKRYNLKFSPAEPNLEMEQLGVGGSEPIQPEHAIMQEKALNFIDKTRKYPKRLEWAAVGKPKFEAFLDKFRALNDDMMGFLEAYERNRHFKMQEATFLQIIHVNNRVGDLFDLVSSLQKSPKSSRGENELAYEDRLIRLTRFKAFNLAIEAQRDGGTGGPSSSAQDPLRLAIMEKTNGGLEIALDRLSRVVSVTK